MYEQLAEVGDFRRGSVNETYRRCGKPNCACADAAHPGHGPRYLWTRSVDGKTQGRQIAAGAELDKVTQEIANYRAFLSRVDQVVEVNEEICEARPISALAQGQPIDDRPGDEKRGSSGRSRRSSPKR